MILKALDESYKARKKSYKESRPRLQYGTASDRTQVRGRARGRGDTWPIRRFDERLQGAADSGEGAKGRGGGGARETQHRFEGGARELAGAWLAREENRAREALAGWHRINEQNEQLRGMTPGQAAAAARRRVY